jgi:hypothetical protein
MPLSANFRVKYQVQWEIIAPNFKCRVCVVLKWHQIYFLIFNDLNILKIVHVYALPKLSSDISANLHATFTKLSWQIPSTMVNNHTNFQVRSLCGFEMASNLLFDFQRPKYFENCACFPLPKLSSDISAYLNATFTKLLCHIPSKMRNHYS